MRCPRCHKETMMNQNDPTSERHRKICLACGQVWEMIKITRGELAMLEAKIKGDG